MATRTAKRAADEARELKQATTLCRALASAACPVMLWVGDLAAAERCIAMLLDHSARFALPSWDTMGRLFQRVFEIVRGDSGKGLRQLRADFDELVAMPGGIFLSELAAGSARAGQVAEGRTAVGQATEQAEVTEHAGSSLSRYASRASFCSCGPQPEWWLRPRPISGKRSTWRFGKARCPWNCVLPQALRGCCGIMAAPPTRTRCFGRFMTGSQKGSRQPT
jgi:hypothetical protein